VKFPRGNEENWEILSVYMANQQADDQRRDFWEQNQEGLQYVDTFGLITDCVTSVKKNILCQWFITDTLDVSQNPLRIVNNERFDIKELHQR
jgi:hypothetical protein